MAMALERPDRAAASGLPGCANARALCSAAADNLAAKAQLEPGLIKRAELYAQAEAQLTVANAYIPFGVPIRWSLVSRTSGFAANRWGVHPLMPLAFIPK